MPDKAEMTYRLDSGLSDREVFLVGQIMVEWGSLEHEVFLQALATFPETESDALPRAMNNLQFAAVLKLWKERVVDQAEAKRAKVLRRLHDEIVTLKPFREALVHGMWHWSGVELSRISTTRIRKEQIMTTHFSGDDLADFDSRLASVNFTLRFPGGLPDLAKAKVGQPSVNRRFLATVTRHRVAKDWLSTPLASDEGEPRSDA